MGSADCARRVKTCRPEGSRRQMVKSVVLAWGSLVWDPRDLQTAGKFVANGPLLPIEFCRISAGGGAIGFVEPASNRQSDLAMESHPQVVATIAAWAESIGYDAAIWTALASNFDEWGKGGEPFSVSAAMQYLA